MCRILPNPPFQLTAGSVVLRMFWACDKFWSVERFRQPAAATELFR